jgi:hypothetical protein
MKNKCLKCNKRIAIHFLKGPRGYLLNVHTPVTIKNKLWCMKCNNYGVSDTIDIVNYEIK